MRGEKPLTYVSLWGGGARKQHGINCHTDPPKLKLVHGNFHIESTVLWNLGSNKSPSGKTEFPYLHERLISKLVVGSWVAQVLCTYSGKAVSSQRDKTGSMF